MKGEVGLVMEKESLRRAMAIVMVVSFLGLCVDDDGVVLVYIYGLVAVEGE